MFDLVMLLMSTQKGWERGLNNRNLQILNQLRKDPRIRNILTIDFLPHTYSRALARGGREIMPSWLDKRTISRLPFSSLKQISSREWNLSSILPIFNGSLFWKQVKSSLSALGFNENILAWSYDPFHPEFFEEFRDAFKIFDAVDNWSAHSNYIKHANELMANYKVIGEKADVIFMVNESLASLFPKSKRVLTVANGVDYDLYAIRPKIIPHEFLDAPHPIIGYAGILNDRVDADIIQALAKKFSQGSLAIVGWVWPQFKNKKLKKLKNIIWCGRVPYTELNLYIHAFDCAIMPHKLTALTKSMDPMKMYEYLACGKPVVTTEIMDSKKFKNLIYISKSTTDFVAKVEQALKADADDLRKKRQELAAHFSWKNRFADMCRHLPF